MPFFRLVPYGPPAALALREAIALAKGDDALAPVTVAVPSNYAGLSLRRSLASNGGLINVRLLVLARVAELLGAPSLAASGRRPLTGPVRGEAVRAALAADPGVFGDVAEHRSTERSLESTFRDLRRAPDGALDAVAALSERARHVVRLYRAFRELTVAYYDEEDLALAAADAVRNGTPALRDVGHVVLHLPRRLSPAERGLTQALAAVGRLSALVGLTGDANADAPARQVAAQLESALGPAEEQASETPLGTHIVAVADAEEEVRTALRLIMARLEQGTPLHRMGLLYPTAQPYALLAQEQFAAAGVPCNGPSVRTLAQTLSGRTLLGLLHLQERNFSREAVMDWLSAAPLLEEENGRPAPAHRWDTLSRAAGVVAGAPHWRDRLLRHLRSLEAQLAALERTDEGEEWRVRRLVIEIEQTQRLARFMEALVTNARPGARTWAEFGSWARRLLERYLGGEGHRASWPDDEIEAHRAVQSAIDALGNLGELRPVTDEAVFRRALERELEAPARRIGRFGEGVFIGRIADALGTDFDAVFLVGMTEGLVPSRGRDDPLLPDHERTAGDVPPRTTRQAEERRDYLAALACAPERVLVFPRADLRGQRGRLPAYWLLETASALEGRPLFSSDIERLTRPWHTVVPSFEGALKDGLPAASSQEYDLRSLLLWRGANRRATEHYLATTEPALGEGLRADLSRQGSELTRWDGRIEASAGLRPSAERPVSPTALQNWAACPFRYFLGHVLRVAETEKPGETLMLTPLERGNLIHTALERFVRHAPARSSPDQPWSDEERALLSTIGDQLCDDFEARGVTGKPLLWRMERARILRDLAGFLDHDEALRREHGVVPAEVELAFGLPGAAEGAVEVTLDGLTKVAFRGRIDRIDRAPDGSRLLVLDYKSGGAAMYKNLQTDPVQRGRLLQLPIYALAAKQRFGGSDVEAYYWFVTEREGYNTEGYRVGPEQMARFQRALAVILGGIERGLFPARPGPPSRQDGYQNCQICPYDRVCPRDRARVWERKRLAAELHDYLDMAGE